MRATYPFCRVVQRRAEYSGACALLGAVLVAAKLFSASRRGVRRVRVCLVGYWPLALAARRQNLFGGWLNPEVLLLPLCFGAWTTPSSSARRYDSLPYPDDLDCHLSYGPDRNIRVSAQNRPVSLDRWNSL